MAPGLRVLFVTNLWPDQDRPWRGSFVHNQAEGLRTLGVQVDVMPIRGFVSDLEYAKAVVPALRLNHAPVHDIVHAHVGQSALVARLQVRAPLVISYHGSDLLGKPTATGPPTPRSRVEAKVFRQLARLAAATITMSPAMSAMLPSSCRPRNVVIPTGVDVDRFAPGDKAELRRSLGWDPHEPVVLWVGDPAVALKNFGLAEATMERLESQARLRVATQIHPRDVPSWLAAADVLLLTSRSEGSPTVVKEAMACELPVVSTDVGDVAERIDGLPGCAIAEEDPADLAAGLRAALEHGPVPEARERIRATHSEVITAGRILDLYENVLSTRGRRERDVAGQSAGPAG